MDEEYLKFSNTLKDLSFIRDELSTMNAFLEILADKEELDPLTKDWKRQVREMAYDIEDWIDEVIRRASQDGTTAGFIEKIIQHINMVRTKIRISSEMQQIKTHVMEVSHRRKRYKIDVSASTSRSKYVPVDPRLHTLYADENGLEGIDGPRNQLVKWLLDEDQQLRVVSILGIGGLGKTTLANEVYKRIGEKFDCQAFVSVSQRPDLTRILTNMFSQLGQEPPSQPSEVQNLINVLREHLQDKRYLSSCF